MQETAEADRVTSILAAVRDHLDGVRRSIHKELHDYPRPVAGCDQQFNHLLAMRGGIQHEIGRLEAPAKRSALALGDVQELERFIATSDYIDDDARRRLRAALV